MPTLAPYQNCLVGSLIRVWLSKGRHAHAQTNCHKPSACTTSDLGSLCALRVVRLLPITIRSTTTAVIAAAVIAAAF